MSTASGYTDPSSGLTWQNPPSDNDMNWQDALNYCDNLVFDGQSDWRLPSISELRTLIKGCPDTETGGSCGVKDGCLSSECSSIICTGCDFLLGPAGGCYWPEEMNDGPPCYWFFSFSVYEDDSNLVWGVTFTSAGFTALPVGGHASVRCVRYSGRFGI